MIRSEKSNSEETWQIQERRQHLLQNNGMVI